VTSEVCPDCNKAHPPGECALELGANAGKVGIALLRGVDQFFRTFGKALSNTLADMERQGAFDDAAEIMGIERRKPIEGTSAEVPRPLPGVPPAVVIPIGGDVPEVPPPDPPIDTRRRLMGPDGAFYRLTGETTQNGPQGSVTAHTFESEDPDRPGLNLVSPTGNTQMWPQGYRWVDE